MPGAGIIVRWSMALVGSIVSPSILISFKFYLEKGFTVEKDRRWWTALFQV